MGVQLKHIILLGVFLVLGAEASSNRTEELNILRRILNPAFANPSINPGNETGGAVVVHVNYYVRRIEELDDHNHEMSVQLTLRQQWRDPRLRYTWQSAEANQNKNFVTLLDSTKIWRPDLFVSNEKEARVHNYGTHNFYIRIFPDGEVLYSERVSLKLACPMSLASFPFDTQVCPIRIASYGYTTRDIIFKWKEFDPVQVTATALPTQFALYHFETGTCESQTTTGVYSCLKVEFHFSRLFSYYLNQVFIPCTMMVIIGWMGYWLKPRQGATRLILVLATLYVLATQVSRLNEGFPRCTISRSIDVWTGTCVTFVFIALVQAIIAFYNSDLADNHNTESISNSEIRDPESKTGRRNKNLLGQTRLTLHSFTERYGGVDGVMKVLYPLAFVLFAVIYFAFQPSSSNSELL